MLLLSIVIIGCGGGCEGVLLLSIVIIGCGGGCEGVLLLRLCHYWV